MRFFLYICTRISKKYLTLYLSQKNMFSNYRTFSWNKGQHCIVAMLLGLCFFAAPAGAETVYTYEYKKSLGKSGNMIESPYGYYMQAAHEDRNVIYCNAGNITLHRNGQAFFTYARWYNYKTDGAMEDLTCTNANYNTSNGLIWYVTSAQDNKADATFYYNGKDIVYIACDQSSYKDGVVSGTYVFEPTIEQRMIFEIRPASEMAKKVNASTDNNWLETYDIMAPTDQTIHIGPKYAFLGTERTFPYPSYYYSNSQGINSMSSNTASVSETNCTTTVGNWDQTTSSNTETFYVCTEACTINTKSESTTWNLTKDDFKINGSYPLAGAVTVTKNNQNNQIWNFVRKLTTANSTNPEYDSDNGVKFGGGKRAESVVFRTNLHNANNVKVTVKCKSSSDKESQRHILKIKYDNTSVLSQNIKKDRDSYSTNKSSSPVNSVEISFTAQSEEVPLYVKEIKIEYTVGGSYSPGDTIPTEPGSNLSKWKKVVRTVSSNIGIKTDYVSAGGKGWIWLKDGASQTNQSVSSEQYIKVDPVTSASTSTFQLLYSTGTSSTITEYINNTTVTNETIYLYNNGWVEVPASATSNTEIKRDTIVTSSGSGGQIFHIAQFRVQFFDKKVVGPRAAEMSSFINNMELIAEQTFNFEYSSQNPLPTGTTQRFIPLPVEESTFGFYYGTADRESGAKDKCYWNEYSFVSNGYGYTTNTSMANHVGQGLATDATTGFALYADGSQKAGTVFTLDFGAEFCPGAKMFFTAWIGDQNAGDYTDGHPIFTFYVEGIDAEGKTHTLATFTTGEFVKKENKWHHIIFPLEFSDNVDYERFKLRIVNMAATVTNNDFFIDDIRVYLQRAEISPVQASLSNHASCLYGQQDMVLYTRVDYGVLPLKVTDDKKYRYFYYRWYDAEGNPIPATECHYEGHALDSKSIPYGIVTIPSDSKDLTSNDIMANFSAFDNAYYNLKVSNNAVVKYVKEKCVNHQDMSTEERFVAYIATPVKADLGKTYRCVVTYALSSLPEKESDIDITETCSSKDKVTVVNGLCIRCKELGGLVPGGSQAQANANNAYELTLVSETMRNNNNTQTRQVDCYFGYWLFGREIKSDEDNAEEKRQKLEKLYGTTYDNVKAAIQAYIANTADANQQKIVKRLSKIGALKL